MELFSDEIQKVKGLLADWQSHPEIEVEATFGFKGQIDFQSFLRVVTRLRSKGYEAISQEDRLTVSLPDKIRFTLVGAGRVSQYCRDNRMADKSFIAIIKDRNISDTQEQSANIDIDEYDVRVKGRREIELSREDPRVQEALQGWERKKKYFRLIRRWTFKIPGLKFDLSMVRSTKVDRAGQAWQRTFQDQPLIEAMPTYEIEVELDRHTLGDKDPFKTLINGMGDVLRGIQGSPILIRKSIKENALKGYKELTGLTRFRGVKPVTLEKRNMSADRDGSANIRDNYNVTDKADGLRVMGFTNKEGELFLIDMGFNVHRTGFANPNCKLSLLDGEYITQNKNGEPINVLLFFDIYIDADKQDVTQLPFKTSSGEDCRYNRMVQWLSTWKNEGKGGPIKLLKTANMIVGMKTFYFANEASSIFTQAAAILKKDDIRSYHTDGLIFTPNTLPLPKEAGVGFEDQFKWKPAEENTIDFLVSTVKGEYNTGEDKIEDGIHPSTRANIRFKTFHLFVGSSKVEDPAYKDPRATILYEKPLPDSLESKGRTKYRPVSFVPKEFPDSKAGICYMETHVDMKTNEEYVSTERTNEPIYDRSIVEMRYDATKPAGWRWIPIRVRADKNERLLRGQLGGTLNSEETAESVWNSIHNPVTLFMITTGSETPNDSEMAAMGMTSRPQFAKYYERKSSEEDQRKVKALHEFHNKYIKEQLLYSSIGKHAPNAMLLDVAVGRGNDMHRWRRIGANFVLGVDATGECCKNHDSGAYRRLLDTIVSSKKRHNPLPIPPMFFVVGDSSKRLLDGSAGETEEESDILRALLGRVAPIGPVPPAIQTAIRQYGGSGPLAGGADAITCMYALHYFFENTEKLNGLLQNISDNLKIGGYFVGTNFDGKAVFDFLRSTPQGGSKTGVEGDSLLWEITKHYDTDDLPSDDSALGMAIDVNFISIGLTHREYLVPWHLLVAKLKTVGLELLNATDLQEIGLQNSSNMYDASYDMAMKTRDKREYMMNESAKQYSFLNRWYIFKRTSQGVPEIGKIMLEDQEAEVQQAEVEVQDKISLEEEGESPITANTTVSSQALYRRLVNAETKGDIQALNILDSEATELRQTMRGPGAAPFGISSAAPPGTIARAVLAETGLGIQSTATPFGAVLGGPTVPVRAATAQILAQQKYATNEVVKFNEKSSQTILNFTLPASVKSYAGRHLAPNAPFRIRDSEDGTEYPSIRHFLAAMKFKLTSARPELAAIFSRNGDIHASFLASRLTKSADKVKQGRRQELTIDENNEFILNETAEVERTEYRYIAEKSVGFDNTKWTAIKDNVLLDAIRQRLRGDKKFCEIVTAAIAQNKVLLYNNETDKELGGALKMGKIEGQNKYGRFILQLASEMPEDLKACLSLP
jgi:predicted NAD-dependent protein-ADP-ribosyltransferase YbiA (DUF1768 family)